MSYKSYFLDFKGYFTRIAGLDSDSGIYCVYACTDNSSTVSIRKLLYIGESEDIHERVSYHEGRKVWESELQNGEVLCFSNAKISPEANREHAEAAMIYYHKPPCNKEYVNSFPFDHATIQISGMARFLTPLFRVSRTTRLRGVLVTE